MLLAQSTPIATPAAVAVPVDHFIIGDLSKVIAKAPDDWSKIIIHAIGFIAVAYLIGWVADKLMRWVSTKFGSSPIAEATDAAAPTARRDMSANMSNNAWQPERKKS